MYRQYEDPRVLEARLSMLEERYEKASKEGYPTDYLFDLFTDIEDLKQRINHAWQDEEAEDDYRRESYNEDPYFGFHPYYDTVE